jgi:ankyrin repeat protein
VNDWFGTPLCLAVIRDDLAVTELLIEHNADVNQDCFNIGSAAHAACASGDFAVVQALHAAGVHWNIRRDICVNALSHLYQLPQNDRSLMPYHKSLPQNSLGRSACSRQLSPGTIAVKFRHSRLVVFCLGLKNGLSVDETYNLLEVPSGRWEKAYISNATLVMLAISTLDHKTGEALLTHGADANALDYIERGALIYAVDALEVNRRDLTVCVGLPLRHGVSINSPHTRIVRIPFCLEWLDNPRLSDLAKGQETALMHVITDDLPSCGDRVEVLCEHGADVDLLDFTGRSATTMAALRYRWQGEQEVLRILLRHNAMPVHPLLFMECTFLPNYGYWQGVLVRPF